jgi:hypothetical protein
VSRKDLRNTDGRLAKSSGWTKVIAKCVETEGKDLLRSPSGSEHAEDRREPDVSSPATVVGSGAVDAATLQKQIARQPQVGLQQAHRGRGLKTIPASPFETATLALSRAWPSFRH